ncbi:hypothetical protein SELMODRAFT_402977 [Selaginella moellendorffii]|uniref:Uncharacterized protein n=1 Tax=Selaginella moellendorffii TaxID=88036 RepID=D8QNN3_SELML|nr:hypothetical protein SELMODRAFT_402977 [Selaginella moellendorffii]
MRPRHTTRQEEIAPLSSSFITSSSTNRRDGSDWHRLKHQVVSYVYDPEAKDAARLFDMSEAACDVIHTWLVLQLDGESYEQAMEWLAAFETRALADAATHAALVFFAENYQSPPSEEIIELLVPWLDTVPRIECKSIELTAAVRQMLEEVKLRGTDIENVSAATSAFVEDWLTNRSRLYRKQRWDFHPYSDESETMGRLLYTWTLTTRGKSDHAELQKLCGVTTKSFVEHVKWSLQGAADDEEGDRCEELYDAAASVFGAAFRGVFVSLCENCRWKESGMLECSLEELQGIRARAWNGRYQVHKPALETRMSQINDMIIYLVDMIYEDHYKNDYLLPREYWRQDCQDVLFCKNLGVKLEKAEKGVYLLEDFMPKDLLTLHP